MSTKIATNIRPSQLTESNAPVPFERRTLGSFALAMMWFSMAIQIAIFISAGLLVDDFKVWQIVVAIAAGCTVTILVALFTQSAAIRWGINFTVAARIPFGTLGSIIPVIAKSGLSIFWFGFQTWLGALALDEIFKILTGFTNLWLWIIVFAIAQILTTFYGIRFIRWMNIFAAPVLLAMGIFMVYLMLNGAGVTLIEVLNMGGEAPGMPFSTAIMIFVGGWIAVVVSIHDIVKECKVGPTASSSNWAAINLKYAVSQWFGMVPASVIFGFIGAASMVLVGEWNPVIAITTVVGGVSVPLAILFQVFVLLATWSTNPAANLLSPAYAFCSILPRWITFRRGVILAGAIGIILMPWRLADTLTDFMNFLASALGPLAGIMIVDYFLIRKTRISIDDLYQRKGIYSYWAGFNWPALVVYTVAVVVSMLTPDFMFITGLIVSGALYYLVMRLWVAKTKQMFSSGEGQNAKYLESSDVLLSLSSVNGSGGK